jgi:glucose/arabinose dehydrogenase
MRRSRPFLVVLSACVLVLAACGDDERSSMTDGASLTTQADGGPADTGDGDGDVDDPDPDRENGSVADLSGAAITLTLVATLEQPVAMTTRPGSSHLYVAERTGRVVALLLGDDGTAGAGPVVVDITAETTTDGERGLLGVAFDPATDRLYLSFTDGNGHTRVDEWAMDGDVADLDSRRTVYTQEQPFSNHNGGHIAFGPDGYLYLGLGDGGSQADPLQAGQDPTTALGSIIRIDPVPSRSESFTVPDDNPFVEGGGAPEIWLIGVRNPWRFSWDAATGDLWIADVGQNVQEEVTWLPAPADGAAPGRGANLGWALFEGNHTFVIDAEPPPAYVPPVHTYDHGPGCSITGGYVSRGDQLPGLRGVYVYSDFCDPSIRAVLQRDGEVVDARSLEVTVPGGMAVSFGQGPSGELYVLSLGGGLYRLDPA